MPGPTRRSIARNGKARIVGVLALVTAAACGEGASAPEIWCTAFCQAELRCDRTVGRTCRPDCIAGRRGLAHMTVEGATAMAPCLETLSCTASFEVQDMEVDACFAAGAASVPISPHARTFCARWAEAWFLCGSDYSRDSCERDYSVWDDTVRDRLLACQAQSNCLELNQCIDTVFGSL